jgi:hypothetical protein
MFSGDDFEESVNRKVLKEYIDRWEQLQAANSTRRLMSRNAEAFMEQICYWWSCLAHTKDKIKYMDETIASWDRLGCSESKAIKVRVKNPQILRKMIVIQHPDGTLEMDRDMSGRWFHGSSCEKRISRNEWMKIYRRNCVLRTVYVIAQIKRNRDRVHASYH